MTKAYLLRDLEFSYSKETALHAGYMAIEENSVHALLGANGSGKTTLLNLLAFVSQPAKGKLCFFEEEVSSGNAAELRRAIAYVQQKPYLFNFSVQRNIELGLRLRGVEAGERKSRAEKIAAQLGIENLLAKRAHDLSGGEIQKVAIARALVLEPKVLLLDEPFTYLDKDSRLELESFISDIREEALQTVVFSTHDQLQAWHLASHVNTIIDGQPGNTVRINSFAGKLDVDAQTFDTGRQLIYVSGTQSPGRHISIDANQLVISTEKLQSSMRNQFMGKIVDMEDLESGVAVTIEAGERWYANVTLSAVQELDISVGSDIWVSFKSTALHIF